MNDILTFKTNLPLSIKELLKPIFMELSSDTVLEKCLHGKTQNVNESCNAMVWSKCQKTVFCSTKILSIDVCGPVINLNDGYSDIENAYKYMQIETGMFFDKGCGIKDFHRINMSVNKSSEKAKKGRKTLTAIRKNIYK